MDIEDIISLLQDAQGTDYIEESRKLTSQAIEKLENMNEIKQFVKIK